MTLCFYFNILFHLVVEAILGVAVALVVTSDKQGAEGSEHKTQNSAEAYGVLQDIVKCLSHDLLAVWIDEVIFVSQIDFWNVIKYEFF